MNSVENYNKNIFENIKHIDEEGNEYWYARELQKVLEYTKWQNFNKVVNLSMITCKANNLNILDHFTDVSKVLKVGNGANQNIKDYKLSREACYIITLNSDPRKEIISHDKMYFASKTRNFELLEEISDTSIPYFSLGHILNFSRTGATIIEPILLIINPSSYIAINRTEEISKVQSDNISAFSLIQSNGISLCNNITRHKEKTEPTKNILTIL